MMTNTNRIAEFRKARGWSQQQLADLAGTTNQQIGHLESGRRRLDTVWMSRIASALGVEPVELITQRATELIATTPAKYSGSPHKSNMMALEELNIRASAGHGSVTELADVEQSIATWALPRDLVKGHTDATPSQIKIIQVVGDSMAPDFLPGEKVMVDLSDRMPSPPGIFVLWDGFGLVIKRLEMLPYSNPPKVILRSSNPAYGQYERDLADTHINGRVLGRWAWT
jgi:phage repressor protein C with HTH and peptisase S24 domain